MPYVRLNSIVRGHRGVTPDMALRLERATTMTAGFWLNLQRNWDLWHTLHSPAAREIEKMSRWRNSPTPERLFSSAARRRRS